MRSSGFLTLVFRSSCFADGRAGQWEVAKPELRNEGILAGMKVGEVIKLLRRDGWYRVPSRGGHRQFKHPTKPGRVTVSGKASDDLAPGTLNSILKQASLKE